MEELEVALKESLNITAEREEYLSREQDKRHKLEKQVSIFVSCLLPAGWRSGEKTSLFTREV